MEQKWPILSYEKGKDTYETLHMWTQIVGKIKLATLPWLNHSWHVALYITPSGLSTMNMPYKNLHFQIDFDFIAHQLKVLTSEGELRAFGLHGISVADFYQKTFEVLEDLQVDLKIRPVPAEIVDPIPLSKTVYMQPMMKLMFTIFIKLCFICRMFSSDFDAGLRESVAPCIFFGAALI